MVSEKLDALSITPPQSVPVTKAIAIDGVSSQEHIEQKAREFEEIFIADSLKHAKIGMMDSSLVSDKKITDTFSSFMNKALAETIVSQGGFGLTKQITQALIRHDVTMNAKKPL